MAARYHISLLGLKNKAEVVNRIHKLCKLNPAAQRIVELGGPPPPTAVCLSKFTKAGKPYKRPCVVKDAGVVIEELGQPTVSGTCDVHQVPESTVTVSLSQPSIRGIGVEFRETALIDTVTKIEGDSIVIDVYKPPARTGDVWLRKNRFVFDKDCISHRNFALGGVLAVDSNSSVMMQLCQADGKGCEKAMISIELLETVAEQKLWRDRVNQYAGFSKSILAGGYSLELKAAWTCDSSGFSFTYGEEGKRISVNGGLCGFSVVVIPDGYMFKPLRSFMLDASDPRSWSATASLRTACNWIRQRVVSPYGLMENRYVESQVSDLLDAMYSIGAAPNTISPETFGVLIKISDRSIKPVVLPAMDVLIEVPNVCLMADLANINKMIIYNTVAVGEMRNGAPSDYQPSRGFVQELMGAQLSKYTPYVQWVLLDPLGYMVTTSAYIINTATKSPLLMGISVSDATKAIAETSVTALKSLPSTVSALVKPLIGNSWIGSVILNIAFMQILTMVPYSTVGLAQFFAFVRLLIMVFMGVSPVSSLTSTYAAYVTFPYAKPLINFFFMSAPTICSDVDVSYWLKLKRDFEAKNQEFVVFEKTQIPKLNMEGQPCIALDRRVWGENLGDFFKAAQAYFESIKVPSLAIGFTILTVTVLYRIGSGYVCPRDRKAKLEKALRNRSIAIGAAQ
ncbi:MAG: hypothetical protein P4L69_13415 [Desulfosporosinus sp.]|nr:hypothetical protein [Desulfosporosinus sp.]